MGLEGLRSRRQAEQGEREQRVSSVASWIGDEAEVQWRRRLMRELVEVWVEACA